VRVRPRLVVTRGQDRGREYELGRAETQLGRGRGNHIVLTDPSVSRHHLSILVDADAVIARDQGSGNGTLKNGRKIGRAEPLADGDELEVGDTVLRLLISPPRRAIKPALLAGGGVIAMAATGVLVAGVVSGGDPPPPATPPTTSMAPPPPVVISALPEATPPAMPAPAAEPRRRKPPAAPGAQGDAAARYAAREFAEAARLATDASTAKDYALVGASLARGDASAGDRPQVALAAYREALAADARSGEGAHAALLRARVAQVAPAAAVALLEAGRLEEARAACDLAVNYGAGGDERVRATRARLEATRASPGPR
jgi:hypothetical protein